MDQNEIIALGIVALAVFLAFRYFRGKKGGDCCGSGCLPTAGPKPKKNDEISKLEHKEK